MDCKRLLQERKLKINLLKNTLPLLAAAAMTLALVACGDLNSVNSTPVPTLSPLYEERAAAYRVASATAVAEAVEVLPPSVVAAIVERVEPGDPMERIDGQFRTVQVVFSDFVCVPEESQYAILTTNRGWMSLVGVNALPEVESCKENVAKQTKTLEFKMEETGYVIKDVFITYMTTRERRNSLKLVNAADDRTARVIFLAHKCAWHENDPPQCVHTSSLEYRGGH